MRGVRFKKDEREAILEALEFRNNFGHDGYDHMTEKAAKKLKAAQESAKEKLLAALEPKEAGPNSGALERALIVAARGKVVQVTNGGAVYARISRQLAQYNITEDQIICVGKWMAAQKWLTGQLTILTVLAKWPDWSARARASAPPQGTPVGLGGNVRQGTEGGSSSTQEGRSAPGFR